jgi:diadenosine tetraphosphatase ApaH/serine/threonine PP2A family protein phosphatase
MTNRLVAIGDVHGCLEELRELLDVVKWTPADDVWIVGDFLDRGPDGKGVVDFCRKNGIKGVKGNHDDKHVRFRKHLLAERAGGKKNPMNFNPFLLNQHLQLSDTDIEWLDQLPLVHVRGGVTMVHAGFNPLRGTWQVDRSCMFMRFVDKDTKKTLPLDGLKQPPNSEWWFKTWNEDMVVVYGHSVHSYTDPRVERGTYGIDTGCCFGGRLTAAILNEQGDAEFFQVQAKKAYHKPFGTQELPE